MFCREHSAHQLVVVLNSRVTLDLIIWGTPLNLEESIVLLTLREVLRVKSLVLISWSTLSRVL
jgi:hypothetical protein